jgi:cytochrome c2
MTLCLLALAAVASGVSLVVQHRQSATADRAHTVALTGGDPKAGRTLFDRRGCGACHAISNDRDATGLAGPPLGKFGLRSVLAGEWPNDPAHLIAWVQHPQAMKPGVGMPDAGLTEEEARDVSAYLYTLR